MTLSETIMVAMEIAIAGAFVFFIVRAIVSKIARRISLVLAFIAVASFFVMPSVVEDFLFFKEDARIKLKENNIVLHDKFKILSHSILGMGAYETFELEISEGDRAMIDQIICSSPYMTDSISAEKFPGSPFRLSQRIFCDNENVNSYQRQSYQKLKLGYVAGQDKIVIGKSRNRLVFERINE